jgi:hypothetical protein
VGSGATHCCGCVQAGQVGDRHLCVRAAYWIGANRTGASGWFTLDDWTYLGDGSAYEVPYRCAVALARASVGYPCVSSPRPQKLYGFATG